MFRFIDLFAGIGGMRLAAEAAGGSCVFSCERNAAAARTYLDNFGDDPTGDVTLVRGEDVPPHDLVLAGFPCQPFSASGLRMGFRDPRGNMFFEVARLADACGPSCLVLENVRNFALHDDGKTLGTVLSVLDELGYRTDWKVLNAVDFGLPQNRERTIIVASRLGRPDLQGLGGEPRRALRDILEPEESVPAGYRVPDAAWVRVDPGLVRTQPSSGLRFTGYLDKRIRTAGVRPGTEHLSRVHRQCNRIHSVLGSIPTLAASETSGRHYVELEDGTARKLTLRECYRAQGFPDAYRLHPSAAEAYRQVGNSVPVPMLAAVLRRVVEQGWVARADAGGRAEAA